MPRKESFSARRRRLLARQISTLEKLESRNSIGDMSSPLGMAYSAITAAGLYHWLTNPRDEAARLAPAVKKQTHARQNVPIILPITAAPTKHYRFSILPTTTTDPTGDWLLLSSTSNQLVSSQPSSFASSSPLLTDTTNPQNQPQDSGALKGSHDPGNTVSTGTTGRGAITPLRIPAPASGAPVVSTLATPTPPNHPAFTSEPVLVGVSSTSANGSGGNVDSGGGDTGQGSGGSGGGGDQYFNSLGGKGGSGGLEASDPGLFEVDDTGSGAAMASFTHFKLYTLDYNYGTVLFPGFAHSATLGAAVDLRAQVADDVADTYTFSWDTTNLSSHVNSLSATNTYKLTFSWKTNFPSATTASTTLTVTNSGSQTEVQTYTFRIPAGSTGSGGGSAPTWPEAIGGDLLLPGTPAFMSHYGLVDSSSGAFGTTITLPAYSPNFAPLTLTYDSLAADARPIVMERHTLDAGLSVPTKTSASLTFNGTAGTTYYYDTSKFIAGDIQQIPLQADATALSTGRYDYTITVADYRSTTTTTTTITGKYNLINEGSNPLGAGWTLEGLSRVHEVTGGVILSLGFGARSLWFASASGGGYTTPKGDFSTLSKSGSTFTRTLKDGTKQYFNSSGYQTSSEDRNGLRVTYTYDGSNKLTSVTDPYSKVSTFAYLCPCQLAPGKKPALFRAARCAA